MEITVRKKGFSKPQPQDKPVNAPGFSFFAKYNKGIHRIMERGSRRINVIAMIMFTWIVFSCQQYDPKIVQFVDSELALYPEARLTDIYKSFFQDAYGPDHLIPDTVRAGMFLSRELANEEWPDTMKFQPTGMQHDYIRINLLLVKNGIIPRDTLLLAMVKSAPLARNPGIGEFRKDWEKAMKYIEKKYPDIPDFQKDKQTIQEILDAGDVVIHHSDHYNQTYQRRYRIIHRSVFDTWKGRYF